MNERSPVNIPPVDNYNNKEAFRKSLFVILYFIGVPNYFTSNVAETEPATSVSRLSRLVGKDE